MAENDDIETLQSFLTDFQDDLGFIVKNAEEFLPGYYQGTYSDHYQNIRESWEGTEEEVGVSELISELKGDVERSRNIEGPEIDLERHGLTGNQLHFKLQAVNEMRTGFTAIRESWNNINNLVDSVRVQIIGQITASYLDSAETVLDSILDAVGAKEAIREFKEMIRNMLPF